MVVAGVAGWVGWWVLQDAGGQQAQVGRRFLAGGENGVPRRSKGNVRGLMRRWKMLWSC